MRPGQPPGSTSVENLIVVATVTASRVVESRFAYSLRIQEARSCEIVIGGQLLRLVAASLVAVTVIAGPTRGQQGSSASSTQHPSKGTDPVVRTFGAEGGFRTEVTSRTRGSLSEEDRRQISLLMAQVFEHIVEARDAVDADDTKQALEEVNKARAGDQGDPRHAAQDDCPHQDHRPRRQGGLRGRARGPGVRASRSTRGCCIPRHWPRSWRPGATRWRSPVSRWSSRRRIATEAIADLDPIERQLTRAAKALEDNKTQDAAKALALALIRGIDFRFRQGGLAAGLGPRRDLAGAAVAGREQRRTGPGQPGSSPGSGCGSTARWSPQDQRQEVDQMLQEVDQLEAQLRQEATQPATRAERTRQGGRLSRIGGIGSTVGSCGISDRTRSCRRTSRGEIARSRGRSDSQVLTLGRRWILVIVLARNWWALVLRGLFGRALRDHGLRLAGGHPRGAGAPLRRFCAGGRRASPSPRPWSAARGACPGGRCWWRGCWVSPSGSSRSSGRGSP